MEIVKLLGGVSLFKGLPAAYLAELAMIVTDQEFGKGQVIFSEGDEGDGFFVVIAGRVKIYKVSPEGKEQILHLFGPGEPFAEVSVFTGARYPAHAETLAASRIFFFPRESFVSLIRNNPDLAMNMLASLSLRLKQFSKMIETLSLKEVPGRLAAHILFLSRQNNNAGQVELDMAKAQLASLLGTIPETLSRILARMSKSALIEINGPQITILDQQGLTDLAEGETRLT